MTDLSVTTIVMYLLHPFISSDLLSLPSNFLSLSFLERLWMKVLMLSDKVLLGLLIAFFGHHFLIPISFFTMALLHFILNSYLCDQIWHFIPSHIISSSLHSPLIQFWFVFVWPLANTLSLTPFLFTTLRHRLRAIHILYLIFLLVFELCWHQLFNQFLQSGAFSFPSLSSIDSLSFLLPPPQYQRLLLYGFGIVFGGVVIHLFPEFILKHLVVVVSVAFGLHLANETLQLMNMLEGWKYALLFSFCVLHQHLDPIVKYYQLDEIDD
jgi:hypothetical protein